MTEQQTIDVESQIQVARGVFILLCMAAWRNLSLLVGTQRDPTHWHPPAPSLISTYYIFGSVKIAYEYSNKNLSFNALAQFLSLSCIMQLALFFHHKLSIAVKESRRVGIKAKYMRSLSTQTTTPGQHSQSRN
jgi:hypothetical protein